MNVTCIQVTLKIISRNALRHLSGTYTRKKRRSVSHEVLIAVGLMRRICDVEEQKLNCTLLFIPLSATFI